MPAQSSPWGTANDTGAAGKSNAHQSNGPAVDKPLQSPAGNSSVFAQQSAAGSPRSPAQQPASPTAAVGKSELQINGGIYTGATQNGQPHGFGDFAR